MLLQRMKEIQKAAGGYLPEAELEELAHETKTPLYRLQELASFFPHFRREGDPPPYLDVKVCRDMACHLRGAKALTAELKMLESHAKGREIEVGGVSCLGRCDRAVAVVVNRSSEVDAFHDHIYAGRSPAEMVAAVKGLIAGGPSKPDTDTGYTINRADWQIDYYAQERVEPNYEAIRRYVREFPLPVLPPAKKADGEGPSPREVEKLHPWLANINGSGLVGMGGAGMPAYLKWLGVWLASAIDGSDEKYIVCNGDESEPATFKDREILLRMPHLVVEGVIMAGLLSNATRGWIFIRHEYTEQIAAVKAEIERARKLGAWGRNVFGSGRNFEIAHFESAGGYICGEQSALIESMEDRRAQPRNKPPELLTNGLYDRPTAVNNVETIAWAPAILLRGGQWYVDGGHKGNKKGRRFFSICGDVNAPGVFEVPSGIPLGDLVAMAGGLKDGQPLSAVALSGPSGGLIPARIPISPKLGLAKELEKLDRNLARTLKGLEADDARMARETEEKIASARADAEREKQELQAAGYYRIEGDLNQSLVLLDANLQKTVTALEEALKSQRAKQPESIEKAKQTTESGKKRLQGLMASVQGGDDWIDALKLPLQKEDLATLESISGVGLMLGAGIALYTAPCDILDHSQNFTEFFSNESCGKCVPCRIGSTKLARMGHELLENRKARPLSLELVEGVRGDVLAINEALGVTSICSLGQVAGSPLAKALAYFADELQNPQPV